MSRMKPTTAELRGITSVDGLLGVLAERLDWPLTSFDMEEITFDWDVDELGLAGDKVPNLTSLRQLRPLITGQPWGIFFLEFSGDRLPLGQMRRMLDRLVAKKRATGAGTSNTWRLDDLLFLVSSGAGESLELHFVAFTESPSGAADFRSLAWRPRQSPEQLLRRLSSEVLPKLAWPSVTDSPQEWSAQWRQAFALRPGEAISSASRLAANMASVAHGLRSEIGSALAQEAGAGPFNEMLSEIQGQLVADVDDARFADMCAQTLVYGLLASRVTDRESFGVSPLLSAIPLSNPFLTALFAKVQDQASVLNFEEIGLEALVADLRETNVEAVLDQFGSSAKGGDPVIHFYEEFLKAYDSKMRADSGAFYTPQPVVEFMVRAVDELLRERFGLVGGISSSATWAQVAEMNDFEVPESVPATAPFVTMIDPATGTGTFLVEWLKRARVSYEIDHDPKGWPQYLRSTIVPSMHAFELMLAPYTIAHLKVAIELSNHNVELADLNILLTDTLDYKDHAFLPMVEDPVAAEGAKAADLKNYGHFSVTIGNPPYDREQRLSGDTTSPKKGGIARFGVPGTPPLMNVVLDPLTDANLGKHAKNAYNDYVYFWTWATWQTITRHKSPGVVAFITASSYLDGISLGGLRKHFRDVFDELWIVDLGGDSRGAVADENVFEIRTPVSIAFGLRRSGSATECRVRYLNVTGTRDEKLKQLRTLDILSDKAATISGTGLEPLTPRGDLPYYEWPAIDRLFPWMHSGSQVKRAWPIAETEAVATRRWDALLAAPPSAKASLLRETPDRRVSSSLRSLRGDRQLEPIASLRPEAGSEAVVRYGYRSFDRQWFLADTRLADRPRPDLWRTSGPRQVFLTTLTSTKLGNGPVVTATPYVPDLDHFRGSFGSKNVIPLFLDADGTQGNITTGLLEFLTTALGRSVSTEALACYVYGLTGTAAFSAKFATELAEGAGPVRIPMTSDPELFERVVLIGRRLLSLHTWGERFDGPSGFDFLGDDLNIREPSAYPETFGWKEAEEMLYFGDGSASGVPKPVWEFSVSGLQVVKSWLGYRMLKRKGKSSSPLDEIRPDSWSFTGELVSLLAILKETVRLTPVAAELLDAVVAGATLDGSSFPVPSEAERNPPKR